MHLPAELDNVPGVQKTVLCLSAVTDEKVTLGKPKMNQGEGYVSIGDPFSKHASRARGITNTKIFCGMFRRLLTKSIGPLIRPSLTSSLPRRKILHLAPMEFHMALTDVRVDWTPSSSSTLISFCGRRYRSRTFSLKVGQSLSPKTLTSMTMEDYSISGRASSVDAMQL